MTPFLLIVFLCTVPLLTACHSSSPLTAEANQSTNETILFQDDFSDPNSGWSRINVEAGSTDYTEGGLRIHSKQRGVPLWSNPKLIFNDSRLEVDATKEKGSDNNLFGIICRYQDGLNFYALLISSEGYYGVVKVVDGQGPALVDMASLGSSEAIQRGQTTNHLRADCAGTRLALYANDRLLISVNDTTFSAGDVGLLAVAFEAPGVEVFFDNFSVHNP